MFTAIAQDCGYQDLSYTYDHDQLLELAEIHQPGRLEQITQERALQDRRTPWHIIPSKKIIDWVYRLDYICALDSNSITFGFDATEIPERVASKQQTLKTLRPLWQSLGVCKVAVVLLIPPSSSPDPHSLSYVQRDHLVEELYELITTMHEASADIQRHILAW
ncbi:hypothetical protein [Lyngbya confervoides]|uniref:Uncharacterized protein n=1 Tax=Lyngbya confervoides BDU141951 TaxID=1574623 RepID=A0ABD4T5K4_9CYAN|nr:hypothetical protein [Lyngbya confervoides]MCM1983650.1 hypothetical protein [Lyngbya confervoides BDU141951]